MKKHIWFICFSAALILFTTYIALDTFVIRTVYDSNATEINASMFPELIDRTAVPGSEPTPGIVPGDPDDPDSTAAPEVTPYSDENTYIDQNISIVLTEYEEYGTAIYVADVRLSSAAYLKTAFAKDKYGRNITETTSNIARTKNAILAVNGDFYGAQQKGYVIRNGIVYRDSAKGSDVLCIYADGTMEVVSDRDYKAEELVERGVWQAFTFGPALLEDGGICVGKNDEVDVALASNPRTALGVIEPNHFVFVVSDGRTSESDGLTLYELARFMQGLGVKTAYNLDGGGSSTMYFNGRVVNNPTSGRVIKERKVSDIVYIGA